MTDSQIRRAIQEGARSMRALRQRLGVCSDCGKCGPCAREVLREYVARAGAELLAKPAA